MAKEISVTGQKKVGKLMRELNELYPYLGLRLYSAEATTLPKGLETGKGYTLPFLCSNL